VVAKIMKVGEITEITGEENTFGQIWGTSCDGREYDSL